jgi:hypothetical protein
MVRALLAGAKRATRRHAKAPIRPDGTERRDATGWPMRAVDGKFRRDAETRRPSPYGAAGDRLWVKEAWAIAHPDTPASPTLYRATDPDAVPSWRNPLFMPRVRSRLVLQVIDVRVEPLHAIDAAGAIAEGLDSRAADPRAAFARLWDAINGAGAWNADPFVWVVEFDVLHR